ncbi:MAG: Ig-like domain-containing protein, partial [Bacilli bacterium]|nr:Ig-like domain-containing protein [Bacilli bacterium]
IDGLTFTQTGQVSIAPAGGVSNFTFINNHVYDTTASMSFIYFPNTGSSNSDFVIENNVFEIINAKSIQSRYIRGGNVTNVRVVNNSFEGVIGQYTDAIRLEGTNSGNAAGIGASGEIIIQNNQFASIGQRSIWITRYSATLIDISDNTFDKSGDQSYGGGVQIQVWVPGQETAIILSRNVMKNIGGSFCFRINNEATWTGAETWSVEAHYNAFFDMFDTAPYDDFIQAYAPAAASLINADYNLFFKSGASIVPATDRMPNVGSYTHQITSLDDLAEAILFDKINHSEDNLLLVGTHEKITKTTYSTLALAYEAAQPGDTILLLPGTYSGNITIDKANLSLVSLNEEKDPTDASLIRQAETIFNGKITLAKELENFTISGFRFTGTAQIVNTIGNAGTALAPATNLKGFTFANNIVETGLTTGNGFIYFVEASSSYSHDLVFANNTFKTTAVGTTLSSVVYIDNCFNLTVVGNEFKDITGKGFYINDTTKGLSGYVLVQGNTFENITGSGFWANWLSPLPGTAGIVRVVDNQFKNVTVYGVYIGRMNNSDTYQEISVQFNTFETVGTGARFDRVHTNSNVHFNYNKFIDVPSVAYVFDEKREDTSSPVTLDATKNLYMEAGIVITPNAAKFSGLPNYAEAYTEESALPVYLGEGEMMMTSLTIDPIVGKVYIDDKYQLTYSFTPEEATAIDVTWDSSDITIATVSATGELNALKTGTVTITATSVDNPTLKATIEITVYVFETIELRHEDNGVVKVGETSSLTVSTYPTTLAGTITFTSKTPAVATVDSTGAVTGVAEGTAEIEAAIGSTIVATITVIVKNDAVAEVDPIQFLINANAGNALMRYISTFGNTTKTELVYGAVTKIWFGNLNIIEALAPIGNSRPGDKLTSLEFIVVHDTGNNNLGANGLMHKNYLNNSDPGVSWHYVVDDEGAYHQVPNDEVAYHAGDGSRPYGLTDTGVTATTPKPVITISQDGYYVLNGTKSSVLAPKDGTTILTTAHITDSGIFTVIGTNNNYYINNTYYNTTYKKIANQGGNRHSIGIESCVDEGSDLYGTWQRLAKLVSSLLDENDLTLDRVLQHNNMSGKNCPQTLRMATLWSYFMEMVTYEYELRTTFKDYTFTFVSNDPTIVDNTGKIISKPKVTTEVSYTVTITGPAAYNQSITLYATIPGTKILG